MTDLSYLILNCAAFPITLGGKLHIRCLFCGTYTIRLGAYIILMGVIPGAYFLICGATNTMHGTFSIMLDV